MSCGWQAPVDCSQMHAPNGASQDPNGVPQNTPISNASCNYGTFAAAPGNHSCLTCMAPRGPHTHQEAVHPKNVDTRAWCWEDRTPTRRLCPPKM
eukprot:354461-Chlamydomonas_euryale.AAC.4